VLQPKSLPPSAAPGASGRSDPVAGRDSHPLEISAFSRHTVSQQILTFSFEYASGMPRQPRIEYPGAIYHVMARGDRREPIVLDDTDRECFVGTLGDICGNTGWQVMAWVLMDITTGRFVHRSRISWTA